jgi:hypothetical protein
MQLAAFIFHSAGIRAGTQFKPGAPFLPRSLRQKWGLSLALALLSIAAMAQNNPIPQVVGPVHPDAVAPGSGAFTLSVYGANFVPGLVVNWNYQPRVTTFISGHEIQAQILASDVKTNTAGYITVTNPPPGGGSSSASWAQVEVHDPISTITLNPYTNYGFGFSAMQAADFTHDGILDLIGDYGNYVDFYKGEGNGDFVFHSALNRNYFSPSELGYGDFNNDGIIDVALLTATNGMQIMLGNGKGTFTPTPPFGSRLGNFGDVAVGDFNKDGNLDLITKGETRFTAYLGSGDATFQLGSVYDYPSLGMAAQILMGDFNGDGKLDLIMLQSPNLTDVGDKDPGEALWFLQGNGDGTFQSPVEITKFPGLGAFMCSEGNFNGTSLQLSDFNGDGKLDLAFCNQSQIGVMLGNGDGTFQPPTYYTADANGAGEFGFAVGDINSDGKPDLIVSEYSDFESLFVVFLGNGDGTFQAPQTLVSNVPTGESGITLGDFNTDGLLDVIFRNGLGSNVFLQAGWPTSPMRTSE